MWKRSPRRHDQSDFEPRVNAHQDKIARSCDSRGESTPRPATTTTPRSIIRHAGAAGDVAVARRSRCTQDRATRLRRPTAVSVGIDDRRYCNRRTEESRSIHSLLLGLVLWNDRSALVGVGTLARPRCADPFRSSDLGPPDRVDFGVLQIVRKGQTHASSARVSLIALPRATVFLGRSLDRVLCAPSITSATPPMGLPHVV